MHTERSDPDFSLYSRLSPLRNGVSRLKLCFKVSMAIVGHVCPSYEN